MWDLHVHTAFSCDSEAEIARYAQRAVQIGLDAVCFTDHVDYNPADHGCRYYRPEEFLRSLHEARAAYGEQVMLCAGMEFSEPHLYGEQFAELSRLPFDCIIGSIHWIGNMFPCREVRARCAAKEFYTLYWNEMLKTVRHGGFDVLGHLDFPKRYYQEIWYREDTMREIFSRLIDGGMVPEINTSSLRKGYPETLPGDELLQLYRAVGGRCVTIGSDAHTVEDLGADCDAAERMAEELGLVPVMYVGRKRRMIGQRKALSIECSF
ncbi:MAG: histidinol-phosphatase HisJ family protein [Ruminococcaceae bacterium]|nr:histidinol-phosphatase HisJ family protein [Oscillospiraceae bacterium]